MKHAYAGEVLFKRYADTSTQGQTVTFTLPGRAELEAFIGLEGKRFQAVFVQIGDDELPAEPQPPAELARKERERIGELCWWAVQRCRDPQFLQWVGLMSMRGETIDEAAAKALILRTCNIESRTELDTNPEAARIFKKKIMTPYREYLERQKPIHEPEPA